MTRTRIATAVLVAATAGLLTSAATAAAAPATTQLEQFERAFTKIDADASGTIEETDVEARKNRWYDEFNVQPSSEAGRKIDGRAWAMWQEFLERADANGDQKISWSESEAWQEGPSFVQKIVLPSSVASFDITDRDGDNLVALHEMREVQLQRGVSDADIRTGFRHMDTDQNGLVHRDEFAPTVDEVYLHDQPDRALTELVTNFI